MHLNQLLPLRGCDYVQLLRSNYVQFQTGIYSSLHVGAYILAKCALNM